MFKVTRDAFVKAIEEAVEEEGADKRFPCADEGGEGCRYFDEDGKPVCIVGHALAIMGMGAFGVTTPMNETRFASLADDHHIHRAVDVGDDWALATAIDAAQGEQDGGATWGDALRVFHEELGRQS